MITMMMHEYDYKYDYYENKCTRLRVWLLWNDFHVYFREYPNPVSTVNVIFSESIGVIIFMLLCHYLVFKLITAIQVIFKRVSNSNR